jgi:uncharacterized protein (DUF924 family)
MTQDNQSIDAVIDFWFGPQSEGFATRPRAGVDSQPIRNSIAKYLLIRIASQSRGDGALTHWPTIRAAVRVHRHRPVLPTDLPRSVATDPLALGGAPRRRTQARHQTRLRRARVLLSAVRALESESDQHVGGTVRAPRRRHAGTQPRPLDEALRFARGHRDIVARFGRFPHRNAHLGRASTHAELEFLRTASRFGQ